mmetsp:Transcript_1277/g.2764  ORF Transcript_1277/g.2764 Transcript_1277/m.2764 type:complete len:96 (+) Transcript_1277:1230-1517(+)
MKASSAGWSNTLVCSQHAPAHLCCPVQTIWWPVNSSLAKATGPLNMKTFITQWGAVWSWELTLQLSDTTASRYPASAHQQAPATYHRTQDVHHQQ